MHHRGWHLSNVHFFAGAAALAVGGAVVSYYEKFLLDAALVGLIIVLVWMGVGGYRQNNNGDRHD